LCAGSATLPVSPSSKSSPCNKTPDSIVQFRCPARLPIHDGDIYRRNSDDPGECDRAAITEGRPRWRPTRSLGDGQRRRLNGSRRRR
jgi:hypothetical protein